ERPKAMPALANWITPTEKTIVLDPITVPEEILKARPGLPPATVAPELRCRHWVNSPPQEINSLRGKVVLLAFSATWTKRMGWAEWLAEIQLAHKLYADKGLVVIGIQHHGERNEDVQAWIAKAGLTFPIGIDNANGETFDRYRVNYYPQCVLIGRDGKRIDDRWRNDNFLAAIRKAVLYGEGVDR
ncbi:MAG TPA: TlpA disulfide reductase family protein, partial [Gemmataceae bacterium]|nr:TlpA disulfide reductase family protein [Gemmataceae bacterium]